MHTAFRVNFRGKIYLKPVKKHYIDGKKGGTSDAAHMMQYKYIYKTFSLMFHLKKYVIIDVQLSVKW